jgi:hypothetical protein
MPFTGGRHCSERGKKSFSTAARQKTVGERLYADHAKAAVMAYLERLARDGFARCSEADNGVIELTLSSGEVFFSGRRPSHVSSDAVPLTLDRDLCLIPTDDRNLRKCPRMLRHKIRISKQGPEWVIVR